eukprot:TRINITY_DN7417_c0_g1_i3.p1 TRINITY_DN7417_c0_g1~~TRINITY_DN7417_c0_g1_i3.p1  ORF type:complete len:493 (+),score=59.90 TRINITY_DN7417_c0_g1_i3:36-1481(+)
MGTKNSALFMFGDLPMTDSQRMTLSPLAKWTKYRRLPMKAIVQLFTLLLVCSQIYVLVHGFTSYTRANKFTFEKYLEIEEGDEIMTYEEALQQLEHVVDSYYHLDHISISKYTYIVENHKISPVKLTVKRYIMGDSYVIPKDYKTNTSVYYQDMDDKLGPFNEDEPNLKKLFYSIITMKQEFIVINNAISEIGSIPFKWHVMVEYSHVGGVIDISVSSKKELITDDEFSRSGWLTLICLLFSMLSFMLSIKAIISGMFVYRRSAKRFNSIPKDRLEKRFVSIGIEPITEWKDIPFRVKFEFFSVWNFLSCMGDMCVILSNGIGLYEAYGIPTSDFGRILLGVGTLLLFLNVTKYLEYYKKFYTLILTLKLSGVRVLRFIVSVMPLFIGYTLAGAVSFSPYSENFLNFDETGVTLFSLLNGDDIHATFSDLNNYPYPLFGRLYLYTFISLFITVVLNIFIFIIETAYDLAKAVSLIVQYIYS